MALILLKICMNFFFLTKETGFSDESATETIISLKLSLEATEDELFSWGPGNGSRGGGLASETIIIFGVVSEGYERRPVL